MTEDVELDYDYLAQRALRRVVRDALQVTADLGKAPGKHHFYIEFATGAEGVVIPADLASQFPDRMTIVLQHKFESLTVEEESFSVTLWFKGKAARLVMRIFDAPAIRSNPHITTVVTPHGGHCGFVEEPDGDDGYYAERVAIGFLANALGAA